MARELEETLVAVRLRLHRWRDRRRRRTARKTPGSQVSTGDFEEALAALLGMDAGGLSTSTIARLAPIRSYTLVGSSLR